MINKQLVEDLDKDILLMALNIFLKNANKEIPLLIKSIEKGDEKKRKKIAHKLAGSSISVGLEDFSQLMTKVELQGSEQPTQTEIINAFEKTKKHIQSLQ